MASKSKKVALGGVLGGLCVILLYLAVYLPTSRLFMYGISSVFCSIILIEAGHRWAWLFYASTSILLLIIVPDKVGLIPYLIFFGFYGILKYYIEGVRGKAVQLIIKGGVFLIAVFGAAIAAKELFTVDIYSKLPLWGLVLVALAIFYIYDYVYTLFITYYETKLRKVI
jgi:hypothetical protein